MAHQWFGDLVTMAWWDDLWLNEGFASWMENKTTEHFHPDWGADIDRVGSRERAMGLDALNSTHPVVQQVRTVEQANQAFDAITYSEGRVGHRDARGLRRARRVAARDPRLYRRRTPTGTRGPSDLWAAVERAGASGLTHDRARFHRSSPASR